MPWLLVVLCVNRFLVHWLPSYNRYTWDSQVWLIIDSLISKQDEKVHSREQNLSPKGSCKECTKRHCTTLVIIFPPSSSSSLSKKASLERQVCSFFHPILYTWRDQVLFLLCIFFFFFKRERERDKNFVATLTSPSRTWELFSFSPSVPFLLNNVGCSMCHSH